MVMSSLLGGWIINGRLTTYVKERHWHGRSYVVNLC